MGRFSVLFQLHVLQFWSCDLKSIPFLTRQLITHEMYIEAFAKPTPFNQKMPFTASMAIFLRKYGGFAKVSIYRIIFSCLQDSSFLNGIGNNK